MSQSYYAKRKYIENYTEKKKTEKENKKKEKENTKMQEKEEKPKNNRTWKEEDIEQLVNFIREKKTFEEIAEFFGRTLKSIECKKYNIEFQMLKKGSTVEEVSKYLNCPEDEINNDQIEYNKIIEEQKNNYQKERLDKQLAKNIIPVNNPVDNPVDNPENNPENNSENKKKNKLEDKPKKKKQNTESMTYDQEEIREIKGMSEMIELMKKHNYDKNKIDELTNLVTQKMEEYYNKKIDKKNDK
jgi:hypothetical protein